MIKLGTEDNLGVLKTENQFVIIINERIHGPFFNHDVEKILDLFRKPGD